MKGSRLGSNLLVPDDDFDDGSEDGEDDSSKLVRNGNDRTKNADESSDDEFGLKEDQAIKKNASN